ncbi:MAG: hypothetical protein KIT73_17950 [Burkholderiales bacterium]|nr:hypothetical protein [Burkholderiales bacterium]
MQEKPSHTIRSASESGALPPAPRVVRQQLERLLNSHELQALPRLRDLLSFLVEETLEGRAGRLDANTVGVEVFRREATFDASTDPSVDQQTERLRKALEHFYLSEGLGSPVRIELPRGSYVPVFRAQVTAFRPAIGTSSSLRSRVPRLQRPGGPAVAVLPFHGLPDATADFAAGFAAEIAQAMTRFEGLQVMSSYSTARYRSSTVPDVRRIGADLGARFIVWGTINRTSSHIALGWRLYDAAAGSLLGAEQMHAGPTVAEVLDLLDRVVRGVVARIAGAAGRRPEPLDAACLGAAAPSMPAYEALLHHHGYLWHKSRNTHRRVTGLLRQAVEDEPDYAAGWAALAGLAVDAHGLDLESTAEPLLDQAFRFAGRAVSLDPHYQLARWSLAYVHLHRHREAEFLEEADRAAMLNPNHAAVMGEVGWGMTVFGKWERGLALLAKYDWLNPHHPSHWHAAWYLDRFRQGDFEGALQYAQLYDNPASFWDPLLCAAALAPLGRIDDARREVGRLLAIDPGFASTGRERIRRLVFVDGLDELLITELRKAGLAVE